MFNLKKGIGFLLKGHRKKSPLSSVKGVFEFIVSDFPPLRLRCTPTSTSKSLISRAAISKKGVFTTIDTEETMPLCIDLRIPLLIASVIP